MYFSTRLSEGKKGLKELKQTQEMKKASINSHQI
jgi:hypothetical protein